jgi:hypothetical protein
MPPSDIRSRVEKEFKTETISDILKNERIINNSEYIGVGGNGKDGSIRVLNAKNNTAIMLKGEKGSLSLNDANDQVTVYLEGAAGRIETGGIVVGGIVSGVNGTVGGLLVKNDKDKVAIYLSGDGHIEVGGNGTVGSLSVINDKNQLGIYLSGDGGLSVNGDIKVKGDVILTGGSDCAEDFYVAGAESVEPGTVMVIDRDGALRPSEMAYDKRVAGVISGAGDLRPGITLDRQNNKTNRLPLALTGKVYCKIDAQYAPVEVGDLLTTSPTCGHAMKASDPGKVFGTVIGKALSGLFEGKGLIPILVALQ